MVSASCTGMHRACLPPSNHAGAIPPRNRRVTHKSRRAMQYSPVSGGISLYTSASAAANFNWPPPALDTPYMQARRQIGERRIEPHIWLGASRRLVVAAGTRPPAGFDGCKRSKARTYSTALASSHCFRLLKGGRRSMWIASST
jgi:hypothetical protein